MKKIDFISILLMLALIATSISLKGQVAINTDGSAPHASAMLDVQSNNKGILIPRVANNSSITSPVAGLLVYNTTDKAFYHYDGTSWKMLNNQWTNFGSNNIYYNNGTGGVAIGNSSINSKAVLDITSTSKGVLIPRMTNNEFANINNPPTGLLVYSTDDNAFNYYNGTGWVKITTGDAASQWATSGSDISYSPGKVVIGGTAANISAVLDVQSTTKGILISRMSASQRAAISSPTKGLLVFQNDGTEGFYFYNGTAWNMIFSLTTGNSLPVAQGGTGMSTISPNEVFFGNSTGTALAQSSKLTFRNDTLKVSGTLAINGALAENITSINESAVLGPDYNIIICDPESDITLTLPAVNAQNKGKVYTIKNISSVQTVTIAVTGSNRIDSSSSIVLSTNKCIRVVSGGAGSNKWYILSYFN